MDDENLFTNINVGIWTIEEDGISTRLIYGNEVFIPNNLTCYLAKYNGIEIWERVIHLSGKDWMNDQILNDLMKALGIKRRLLDIQFDEIDPNEIDVNTIKKAFEIMNDDLGWLDLS